MTALLALLAWPGHCVYFPWFPWLRMCLWVCRPGPGQALPADCWRALGSSWDTRDPGPGESPIPWYLGREILCLPLIRTPWAVEVVTRETCDSIRLTLRHQGYLDFIIMGFYFIKLLVSTGLSLTNTLINFEQEHSKKQITIFEF